MTSLEKLTQQGHLYMHPLQFALWDNWDQASDHPFSPVPMPQDMRSALWWWMSPLNLLQGVPLHPPLPQLQLFTDASSEGGGGGSSGFSPDLRHVIPFTEVPAHQQPGTAGGPPCSSTLSPSGHQQGRDSDDGQHHSRQPDQESGQHPLMILVPPDCPLPRVGGQLMHYPSPAPHPGTPERGGRSTVLETSDHLLRVDTV